MFAEARQPVDPAQDAGAALHHFLTGDYTAALGALLGRANRSRKCQGRTPPGSSSGTWARERTDQMDNSDDGQCAGGQRSGGQQQDRRRLEAHRHILRHTSSRGQVVIGGMLVVVLVMVVPQPTRSKIVRRDRVKSAPAKARSTRSRFDVWQRFRPPSMREL